MSLLILKCNFSTQFFCDDKIYLLKFEDFLQPLNFINTLHLYEEFNKAEYFYKLYFRLRLNDKVLVIK